jgi:hypothetical protein
MTRNDPLMLVATRSSMHWGANSTTKRESN